MAGRPALGAVAPVAGQPPNPTTEGAAVTKPALPMSAATSPRLPEAIRQDGSGRRRVSRARTRDGPAREHVRARARGCLVPTCEKGTSRETRSPVPHSGVMIVVAAIVIVIIVALAALPLALLVGSAGLALIVRLATRLTSASDRRRARRPSLVHRGGHRGTIAEAGAKVSGRRWLTQWESGPPAARATALTTPTARRSARLAGADRATAVPVGSRAHRSAVVATSRQSASAARRCGSAAAPY